MYLFLALLNRFYRHLLLLHLQPSKIVFLSLMASHLGVSSFLIFSLSFCTFLFCSLSSDAQKDAYHALPRLNYMAKTSLLRFIESKSVQFSSAAMSFTTDFATASHWWTSKQFDVFVPDLIHCRSLLILPQFLYRSVWSILWNWVDRSFYNLLKQVFRFCVISDRCNSNNFTKIGYRDSHLSRRKQ